MRSYNPFRGWHLIQKEGNVNHIRWHKRESREKGLSKKKGEDGSDLNCEGAEGWGWERKDIGVTLYLFVLTCMVPVYRVSGITGFSVFHYHVQPGFRLS